MIFPISDDNPTLRTPVVTILLLAGLGAVWVWIQGAGQDQLQLAASVCNLGFVPGELTRLARAGTRFEMGPGVDCLVDREAINALTPLTSMFLHGGWAHLLGNAMYLWIFGNNVEDSLGRFRFLVFYLLCGLAAAAAQAFIDPASPVPMVGASGAISGVMGGYLLLYPRVRVNVLFFLRIIPTPAWLVLIFWFGTQLLAGLPQLSAVETGHTGGVAVWAHIGGFVAGVVLVKLMENRELVRERTVLRHRLHPDHP